MANKYDLELALDTYRAQNGKESEIGLFEDAMLFQYGSQRFSSREQAVYWLKQQKPNHDAIQKMIAEERKNYPNSGLGPLMETYEKYYKQVQGVYAQIEKKLGDAKSGILKISAEFIHINGTEIKKGATVFLGDTKAIFTGKYTVDTDDNILQIEITINGTPGYARREDIVFLQKEEHETGNIQKTPEESKYNLDISRGYALQELTKSVRTIRDLKKALMIKGDFSLDINNIFDQATLDAVFAYQRSANLQKIDGLVGSETIGSLFDLTLGNPSIGPDNTPNPAVSTPQPTTSGVPHSVTPGGAQPEGVVEPPPGKEELSTSDALKQLNSAMGIFRSTIKDVSKKSGTFYDTPEEIEKHKASVNEALKKVLPILKTLELQQLSKTDKATYDNTVLEIAKYFDNTLEGIKNRHYRNYDLAFDLALSLIKDDLKKYSIPPRPSQKEVLTSLKSLDPKLQQKIQNDTRAGYDLGQILSNPQVRSQWDSVYEKIYGKYEDDMQTLLKSLKDKRPTLGSSDGQKALDTMISIMGTKDFFDLKARNKDLAAQTGGMIASTIGGIGAVAVSPFTMGASGIVGAALLGGAVTTGGMILTKGRAGADWETGTELGINIATLGLAGGIAKGANIMMKSGTMIARTAGITVDAVGGIALGMGADYVRAWEADTSITLSDSFKNNWYWALLPMAMGAKGVLRNGAEKLQGDMNRAAHQAHNNDMTGAKATIAQAEQKAAELAQAVKAQQAVSPTINTPPPTPSPSPVPRTPPTSMPQNVANHTIPQNTTLPTPAPTSPANNTIPLPPKAVPPSAPTSIPASSVVTSDISHWIESAIPKTAKIDEALKFGNVTIIPKVGGKYEMNYNNTTTTFDTKKDLASGMNKAITDPKDRIKLLESTSIKHIDNHLLGLHESVVPGINPPVRIIREGEGKMAIEVQNPLTKGWTRKNPEALSDGDLTLLVAHYTGRNPVQIRESWLKATKAKLSDHISPAEEKHIVEKHGSKFLEKFKAEFAGAGHTSTSFKDYLIGIIPIPGIGVSKMSWKSALFFTSIVEFLEYKFSQDPVQKNYDISTPDGIKNLAGAAFQVLAYKYMGGILGTVVPYVVGSNIYSNATQVYHQVRESNR